MWALKFKRVEQFSMIEDIFLWRQITSRRVLCSLSSNFGMFCIHFPPLVMFKPSQRLLLGPHEKSHCLGPLQPQPVRFCNCTWNDLSPFYRILPWILSYSHTTQPNIMQGNKKLPTIIIGDPYSTCHSCLW